MFCDKKKNDIKQKYLPENKTSIDHRYIKNFVQHGYMDLYNRDLQHRQ